MADPEAEQPAEGEEDGVVGEDGSYKPKGPSKKLQQTQAQVDEVVEIMKVNLDKVLERDNKLSNLDDRADALQEGAQQFEKQAATLKNKMFWKNLKMTIIIGVVVLIIVIILFRSYIPTGEIAKAVGGSGGGGGGGGGGEAAAPAAAGGAGGGEGAPPAGGGGEPKGGGGGESESGGGGGAGGGGGEGKKEE